MIDEDLFNSKSESPIEERFWLVAQRKIKGLKQQYPIMHNFCIRVDFAVPEVKLIIVNYSLNKKYSMFTFNISVLYYFKSLSLKKFFSFLINKSFSS